MKRRSRTAFLTLFPILVLALPSVAPAEGAAGQPGAVIGIFGDTHGRTDLLESTFERFRALGVTDVIGVGDYVGDFQQEHALEESLAMIQRVAGVAKEHVFLMPGNWERDKMSYPSALKILRAHGHLISDSVSGHGVVEAGGARILVSHYPVYPVPEANLTPPQFHHRELLEAMKSGVAHPADADLVVFGDTHMRTWYYDPSSGKPVINVGTFSSKAPRGNRPGFAVFDVRAKAVRFYELNAPAPVGEISTAFLPCLSRELGAPAAR